MAVLEGTGEAVAAGHAGHPQVVFLGPDPPPDVNGKEGVDVEGNLINSIYSDPD
jgi:hypothetical protein